MPDISEISISEGLLFVLMPCVHTFCYNPKELFFIDKKIQFCGLNNESLRALDQKINLLIEIKAF